MNRVGKKIFLVVATAILFSGAAGAQVSTDLGTWSSVHITKSFDRAFVMARFEHRSFDRIRATECYFAMAGAGYRFNGWLAGDLSYEFWKIPSAGNITTHKAVASLTGTLKRDALAVSLREKYELAFNAAGGAPGGTLRSRLRTQYGLSDIPLTPYLMFELFNGFNGEGWIRSLHYAGAEIKISRHSTIDVFYMYHLFDKADNVFACNILGIGYMLTL